MSSESPVVKLGEVVDNLDWRRVPVKSSDRKSGPYPYYGASGVIDHVDGYLFEGLHLLVAEDGENLRTRKTPIAFLADGKFWVNNHAHILRGNRRADTRYLNYVLACTDISGYLSGSTQPKLTQDNLHRIPVRMPPISEQQAIASFLAALDDKIELNRKMSRTLDEMAQALFQSQFVKLEGIVDVDESGVPIGWEIHDVGDVLEVRGGTTPSTKSPEFWDGGSYAFCTPKDMSQLDAPVLHSTERCVTKAGLTKTGSGLLPVGSVLMSSRAPIGYVALAMVPVAVNQGIIALVCGSEMSNLYAMYWVRANQAEVLARANGSTFLEISKGNFKRIQMLVPSRESLDDFEAIVGPIVERIALCQAENVHLAELRDALLPRLLSGEMQVHNANGTAGKAV